jgi:hypothetical protein
LNGRADGLQGKLKTHSKMFQAYSITIPIFGTAISENSSVNWKIYRYLKNMNPNIKNVCSVTDGSPTVTGCDNGDVGKVNVKHCRKIHSSL